ncbi:MAG: ATP-binding protein [Gammaproteobacteria bacterium]|nr:ATP-binding protein [Gammaproteobacteria bacterium]
MCITGPESTGKTTLCQALARRFGVPWLAEYAREHLTACGSGAGAPGGTRYDRDTVATIAREQWRRERALLERTESPVVLDTDLAVIFVWWQEKYGAVPQWIDQAWAGQAPRLYLLCRPDIGWRPDPLRESPHDLDRLFDIYRDLLTERGLRFVEIQGTGAARTAAAVQAAAPILSLRPRSPVASSPPAR